MRCCASAPNWWTESLQRSGTGKPIGFKLKGPKTIVGILALIGLSSNVSTAQLEATTGTGIGVWYQPGAPADKDLWQRGDPGERLILRIIVRDTNGAAVADAEVETWQADGNGETHPDRYRTRLHTAADGSLNISTVLPGYIWGARHIHLRVTHPGYAELITRVLFRGDPRLSEMPYPELAVNLEEGRIGKEPALFATTEIILRKSYRKSGSAAEGPGLRLRTQAWESIPLCSILEPPCINCNQA